MTNPAWRMTTPNDQLAREQWKEYVELVEKAHKHVALLRNETYTPSYGYYWREIIQEQAKALSATAAVIHTLVEEMFGEEKDR